MTDPASAKRQVDDLIRQQIINFKRSSYLTSSELKEFHARSVEINGIFLELDRCRPLPPYPVHQGHRIHPIC